MNISHSVYLIGKILYTLCGDSSRLCHGHSVAPASDSSALLFYINTSVMNDTTSFLYDLSHQKAPFPYARNPPMEHRVVASLHDTVN